MTSKSSMLLNSVYCGTCSQKSSIKALLSRCTENASNAPGLPKHCLGHHMCKPGIPSVRRVPAAVIKNQEAPFLLGCRQTLYVTAAVSPALRLPASWLQGLTLALRRPASLKEPGTLDTQPACLALGSWFQHLADGYRL
ncbi:unnamed protein product [Rangifer tarandus platyrhynchus]|uniref:Uncharacterized protein n=2 Tax=Rangifer tarandus platyrhynchus TaxID=3082113 RepID=A0ABN8YRU0_RANTA|nr:unnamed protein product [Rangifer tarandus platyrhynchus]CAI9701706.1 unnamed protein product [Rangifer tarandus platyrhynchus]